MTLFNFREVVLDLADSCSLKSSLTLCSDICMHLGCQEIICLSGLDKQMFACCLSLCQVSDSEEVLAPGRRASLSDLRSVEDIEDLSVRQLKEILARNFVDYKGCCEKWELMERVTRLYHDQKVLQNMGKEFSVIRGISMSVYSVECSAQHCQ